MKSIEERAKEACKEWAGGELDDDIQDGCFMDGFVVGAVSEREEILRWRDPKKELPGQEDKVLVNTDLGIFLAYHMGNAEFSITEGMIGYIDLAEEERDEYTCEVIGWRPIVELEK